MKHDTIFRAFTRLLCAIVFFLASPVELAGQPRLTSLTWTSDGALRIYTISAQFEAGLACRLQATTSLVANTWIEAGGALTASPVMTWTLTNTIATDPAYRFFRVIAESPPAAPVNMALVPAGSFEMGDTLNDWNPEDGPNPATPVHPVQVSAFYMDRTEVTKAFWDEVKQWSSTNGYAFDHAGGGKATNHPVHTVNWYDAVKWCNARSEKEGLVPAYYTDAALTRLYKTNRAAPFVKWDSGYRLPTEAEWEKAARGGAAGHRFPWPDVDTITHTNANYFSIADYAYDVSVTRDLHPAYGVGAEPYTSPAGSFAANGYGLYDIAGNLWEWCWDFAGPYSGESQTDPRGPSSGSTRMLRGGSWETYAFYCLVASRTDGDPVDADSSNGFRSVLPAGPR